MSRSISSVARVAIFEQQTDQVFLPLLEIAHSSLGTPLRFVRNTQNIVSGGNTYTAFPFDINLPIDSDSTEVKTVVLVLDNIDRSITAILRSISDPPTITLKIVIASQPDIIEVGPLNFKLSDSTYDVEKITSTLIYEDRTQLRFPALDFNPFDFGGIF